MSDEEYRIQRLRYFILGGSIALLLLLIVSWLVLRNRSIADRPTVESAILETQFTGVEFSDEASVNDLIESAEETVNRLLQEYPDDAAAYNVKANHHYKLSAIDEAKAAWEKALDLQPNFPDALFGLAELAFEAGDYRKAATICENLTRSSPGNPRVPLLLADAYHSASMPDRAILTLEQHITSEPASVQALELLGTVHLTAQNYEKAVACFQRAMEFAPESKDSLYGLGQAHARLGNPEKAREYMTKFNDLATASSQDNASDAQAFEDRDHAAHVAAQVHLDTALVYRTHGELEKAEENILKALSLQPDVVAWLEELLRLLQSQERFEDSVQVCIRLTELRPEVLDHWLNLGGIYAELGMPESAIKAFSKAIELAPEDPRCRRAENIIRRLR